MFKVFEEEEIYRGIDMSSSQYQADRNMQIYTDKVINKMSFKALSEKYGISATRIDMIIEDVKRKLQLEEAKKDLTDRR